MAADPIDWIQRAKEFFEKGESENADSCALIAIAEEARGIKEELRRMNERVERNEGVKRLNAEWGRP